MPLPDTGGLTLTQRTQIDTVYAGMVAKGDGALATAWVSYADTYWPRAPHATLKQVEQGFLDYVVANGLATGIGRVGGFVGSGVPNAAASGQRAVDSNGILSTLKPAGAAANDVAGAGKTAWSAATAVPRFLSMLTNPNLWIRIAEVASGLILLAIGVNAMFKGAPLKAVTKTAGVVAKVVP